MNNPYLYISVIKIVKDSKIGYNIKYIKNNTIIQPENIKIFNPLFVCNGICKLCNDKQCDDF
jgi:hypothetical protein